MYKKTQNFKMQFKNSDAIKCGRSLHILNNKGTGEAGTALFLANSVARAVARGTELLSTS